MNELDEPLRLLRQGGNWALELTRMIAVDRHVLRPEKRKINGADSVVRHLKERCAPALVREALDLIVGQDGGADCVFALEGERWVQLAQDPDAQSASALSSLRQVVVGLRAEVMTLRAMHEALRGRLAQLEHRALQTPFDPARAVARLPGRRDASLRPAAARGRASLPAPDAAAAVPSIAAARTELSVGAEAAAGTPGQPALEPAPAATPGTDEPAATALALPQHADLVVGLRQLLGAEPELCHERGPPPRDLQGFYVSRVLDAADRELAAIVLDLRAGAELGGRLLGLPPGAWQEQAKATPTSDLLDAMNEVANNIGGFINRANLDTRVRVQPLEAYHPQAHTWLAKCRAALLSSTKSGGHLWIGAR